MCNFSATRWLACDRRSHPRTSWLRDVRADIRRAKILSPVLAQIVGVQDFATPRARRNRRVRAPTGSLLALTPDVMFSLAFLPAGTCPMRNGIRASQPCPAAGQHHA